MSILGRSAVYAAGIESGIYKIFLLLHILTVVVGFGGVVLGGFYAREASKRPGHGLAISEANLAVIRIAEKFIYAVPIFGFALIGVSDSAIGFGDVWVSLSILLYVAAVGLLHAVIFKGQKQMNGILAEIEAFPPAGGRPKQMDDFEAVGRRVAATSLGLDVVLIVLLYLMIFKPGA
jgi:hypothetical protein